LCTLASNLFFEAFMNQRSQNNVSRKSLIFPRLQVNMKSVEKPWEHQFLKDCALENSDISFRMKPEELGLARGLVGFHFRIPVAMTMPNTHDDRLFYEKSAFIVCHYSAGTLALRSLCDAILGSYSGASILLRSAFELDLKGAFYQCLTDDKYFSNARILRRDKKGRKLLKFLKCLFNYSNITKLEVEETSIGIFDKLESVISMREYQVRPSVMFNQLKAWDLYYPVRNPKESIYNELYSRLSEDVHVMLDRTDLGKFLLKDPESCFNTPKVDPQFLQDYLDDLKKVMDAGVVLTFNVLKENLKNREIRNSLEQLTREFSHVICKFPYFQECLKLMGR
jgi:hypothetical protein